MASAFREHERPSHKDRQASDELLPLVYDELRRLARQRMSDEREDHTLQPTALVHEAWLRLVGSGDRERWNSRGHFFAAAAEAMRRILIERSRANRRKKRGGDFRRLSLVDQPFRPVESPEDILAVDEAIALLAAENEQLATLVKLRFYAGLSLAEAADALEISRSTATEHWAWARTRLYMMLRDSD